MHRIAFIILLCSQLSVSSLWLFESSNELCGIAYKCNCSKEHKLVDCSSLSITEITSELTFSSAEIVLFKYNQIETLEKNFGEGESVKEIDISHNTIKYVANSAFILFPNLVRLDLSHNRIWNLGPDIFTGLSLLRVLDLSFNNIQSFFDSVFEPTPQLRKLSFKFNPLISLSQSKFQYLTLLEHLDLEYTGIEDLNDNVFLHNPRLQYLSLASNGLKNVPSQIFRNCGRLRTLELSDNPIKDVETGAFKGLSNLTALYLNRMTNLETIKNYAFQDLVNLRTLYCSYNYKLSKIDPLAFATNNTLPLKNIEVIYLRNNALTTLSRKLLNWNSLYHLDLKGNPWNCDCNIGWMSEMHWKHDLQYFIRCTSPSMFSGKLIASLKRSDFICQHHMSAQLIVTLTLITTIAFSTVLVTIGVFLNRKGWCVPCRSRIQTKYHKVSREKKEIEYEPNE